MPKRRLTASGQRRAATCTLSLSTAALLCGVCHGKDALTATGSSSNAPIAIDQIDGVVENFRSGAQDNRGYNEIYSDQIEKTIKQEAMLPGRVGTEVALSSDSISRGLQSSERQKACFWRWDVSCQDDPTYRSKYNLRCDQHVKFDCLSFLGPFNQDEVSELIERCPCSCRVECDTFTWEPSSGPSETPSISFPPTPGPTLDPTHSPTARPTAMPTLYPTFLPSKMPSTAPTVTASSSPSADPTNRPSTQPSSAPSTTPSSTPTVTLSSSPSEPPTSFPSDFPSANPTHAPYECDDPKCQDDPIYSSRLGLSCLAHARFDCKGMHAIGYSNEDMFLLINSCPCSCNIRCNTWTREPSWAPSMVPTATFSPSDTHSNQPSDLPSSNPSLSLQPSTAPTSKPTYGTYECDDPSCQDNFSYRSPLLLSCTDHARFDCQNMHAIGYSPDDIYELITNCPCSCSIMCGSFPPPPTDAPSMPPTISARPSVSPTPGPSATPSRHPSEPPTAVKSSDPSALPSARPTEMVSTPPSSMPSALPSEEPSYRPSLQPSRTPSEIPSPLPSLIPSSRPSLVPSIVPSIVPSVVPSLGPSSSPSSEPSSEPSSRPSSFPSSDPSSMPSVVPSLGPSSSPSSEPSSGPSSEPSSSPSSEPSSMPSVVPSLGPSSSPSSEPSSDSSSEPSSSPSSDRSKEPSLGPSSSPSSSPSFIPSLQDTVAPSHDMASSTPSHVPTNLASDFPTTHPSQGPTSRPTAYIDADFATSPPTRARSDKPSTSPSPTSMPSSSPVTSAPSSPFPTERPISLSPTTDPTAASDTTQPVVAETVETSESLPVYDCSDPACQDDPNYKSPLTLGCDAHIQVDCARLGMVGFTEVEVDSLLRSCPCACGVPCSTNSHASSGRDIIDWTFTAHGVVEGGDYGWEVLNEGRTIRFVVEPSQDCGGGNGGMQTGTATAILTFDEPRPIFYVLGGLGEQLDTSYEKMELRINGELVGRATSQAKNHECSTGPVSVKYAKNPYLVGPGTHVVNLLFTTGDDFDHIGVYYELTLFVDL